MAYKTLNEDTPSRDTPSPTPAKEPDTAPPTEVDQARKVDMKKAYLDLAIMFVIDVGIPLGLYYGLKNVIGPTWAIIVGGVPPFLLVIFKFIKTRKIDVLGCLMIFAFIIGAIIGAITGNPRDVLLRESIVTLMLGIVWGVTLLPIKFGNFEMRPFIFYLSRQMFPHLQPVKNEITGEYEHRFDWCWRHFPRYRFDIRLVTFVWSFLFICEFIGKVIAVLSTLTLDEVVLYSNISIGLATGLGFLFNILYTRKMRARILEDVQKYRNEHSDSNI